LTVLILDGLPNPSNVNVTTTNAEPLILSDELQKARDSLPPEAAEFYNELEDNKRKKAYLNSVVVQNNDRKKSVCFVLFSLFHR
ncbi:12845_t:CDS:1, partial [Cetraspora pellucida]